MRRLDIIAGLLVAAAFGRRACATDCKEDPAHRLSRNQHWSHARPMTRPRFLRRPRTWFSRSRLILTSSARLASSALTEWLSISWTSKPAGSIDWRALPQPPAPGQQPGLQKCLANPGPASPAACSLIFAPNRVCRSRTAIRTAPSASAAFTQLSSRNASSDRGRGRETACAHSPAAPWHDAKPRRGCAPSLVAARQIGKHHAVATAAAIDQNAVSRRVPVVGQLATFSRRPECSSPRRPPPAASAWS